MKNKITVILCLLVNHYFSQTNACFFSENAYSYSFPGEMPKYSHHGDLNNDGKLDLIVGLQSQKIACLIGNGNGTFTTGNMFNVAQMPWYVKLYDVNNDGNLDCISADINLGSVNILLGTGTGSFVNTGTISCSSGPGQLCGLQVVDVNNDSNKDIIVGVNYNNPGSMKVLLGTGSGSFGPPSTYTIATNANAITTGDLNNDGFVDVVSTGGAYYANVVVNWGNATGTYTSLTSYSTGTLTGSGAHIFDYNNDGNKDFVISHGYLTNNAISIFKGNGTSTFTISTISNLKDNPLETTSADYNGDGKIDLAIQRNGGISILNGNGLGTFTYFKSYVTDLSVISNIFSADFNNDGKQDIYSCPSGGENAVRILINETGGFKAMPYIINNKNTNRGVLAYDLNNDGFKDLINGVTEGFEVSFGNASFTFNPPQTYSVYNTSSAPIELFLEDVNSDGKKDVISLVYFQNVINVCYGSGTGTFTTGGNYPIGGSPLDSELSDLNNDNNMDIAVLANGTIKIFNGSSSGTFSLTNTFTVNTDAYFITVADYDNDGNKDIAYARTNSGLMYILNGNGSGNFTQSQVYPTSFSQPTGIESADLNNDTYTDIVVVNMQNTNNVNVFLGTSSGTFQPYTTFSTDAWPIDVRIDDINNDGNKDIATVSYTNETLSILLGTGSGSFVPVNNYIVGRPFQGANDSKMLINDFDNDGLKDVILNGSQTSNSGVIFAMNKNALITTSGTNTFCVGSSINLIANPAVSYSWLPGGQSTGSISVNSSGMYTVTTINSFGCSSSATQSVTAIICTGIIENQHLNASIIVYPNPTNKSISVGSIDPIQSIEIINGIGQSVLEQSDINSNEVILDLSKLVHGVYFIKLKTQQGIKTKKIIIKN